MTATAAKKKTESKAKTFAETLAEKEKEHLSKIADIKETLHGTQGNLPTLKRAASAAGEALDSLEDSARAGESVSGLDLATAKGERDVADLALSGAEGRMRRLGDQVKKAQTRKDVADIIRETLIAAVLPGAESYATFLAPKAVGVPESRPTLIVHQLSGEMGANGVGEGTVEVIWHRSPLHSALNGDSIMEALSDAGFRVEASFSSGLRVDSGPNRDVVRISLRNVSDTLPVVTTPLSDVSRLSVTVCLTLDAVEHCSAESLGGAVLSTKVNDDGVRTMVVKLSALVTVDRRQFDAREMSSAFLWNDQVSKFKNTVTAGLGRCIEVRVVPLSETATHLGEPVSEVQLTYISKAA